MCTVYLPKKVLGDIKELHGLRLGLEVGSGLVPSYYPVIVISIVQLHFSLGLFLTVTAC